MGELDPDKRRDKLFLVSYYAFEFYIAEKIVEQCPEYEFRETKRSYIKEFQAFLFRNRISAEELLAYNKKYGREIARAVSLDNARQMKLDANSGLKTICDVGERVIEADSGIATFIKRV